MSDKMREAFEKWAAYENLQITRGHYYDVYASAETRAAYLAWQAAQAVPVMGEAFQLDCYDAGLLGYGHLPYAEQWHNYIRSELARAHDFYQDQFDNLCSPPLAVMGSPVAWTSSEWLKEKGKLHGMTRPHPSFKVPLYRAPATSITQAELDAKDARIRELEFVIEEIIRINHYDFRGHEIAHAAITKENGK